MGSDERTLRFTVPVGWAVPDLSGVPGSDGGVEHAEEVVRSRYVDTADRALLTAGVTLQQRTTTPSGASVEHRSGAGADAAGAPGVAEWLLRVPTGDAVAERRFPGDDEQPPEPLVRLLTGVLRGRPLAEVLAVTAERAVLRLRDEAGGTLADVVDEAVQVPAAGNGPLEVVRSVSVTVGDQAAEDLLEHLGRRLRKAGARPQPVEPVPARAAGGTEHGDGTAGGLVLAYLAEQQRALLAGEIALRDGDASVIHPTRVAVRRFRSALRVFGPLFDAARARALDGRLRDLAAVLGEVRDRQVLRKRFAESAAALPEADLAAASTSRIEAVLGQEQDGAWRALEAELAGGRHLALLAEVDDWVRRPPLTGDASASASAAADLVRAAEHRVAKRLHRAAKDHDVERLHDARKAAKRARYAAEAAGAALGRRRVERHADRYRRLQDLLGEHQDSVVAAEVLRRLDAGDERTAFALGALYERERAAAAAARRRAYRRAKRL